MKLVLQTLVALALGYTAIVGFVYVIQPKLVYFPDIGREMGRTPKSIGLDFEAIDIATEDSVLLHGWWVPAHAPRGTVLLFHGNAGNISHRLDYLRMFHRLQYAVLIIDYRGYGRSTGTPTEQGTYRDAAAAWKWLTEKRGIAPRDIVLFGESLGAAVASWLAARTEPRALVMGSAFTSLVALGAEAYPFLPVRLVSRFRYDNLAHLENVDVPVLIMHSRDDDIVPFAHGMALFAAAREPKAFIELAGGHNDGFVFMRPAWVHALEAFLERARHRVTAREGTDVAATGATPR